MREENVKREDNRFYRAREGESASGPLFITRVAFAFVHSCSVVFDFTVRREKEESRLPFFFTFTSAPTRGFASRDFSVSCRSFKKSIFDQ